MCRTTSARISFSAKIDHQLNPNNSLTARINWANDLNENIEPFGGNVARSRGAVLESDDLMFALSHLWVGSAKMVNETRFQIADRDQTVNSLDPKCGGAVHARESGRADARSARRRERRAPALHAAAAQERALSGARHRELFHRAASVQGRVRFQLHRRDRAEPSAALRRTVHLRQHSRRVGAAARAAGGRGSGDRRRAARRSGALRAGLRQFGSAVYLQRLFALCAGRLAHHAAADGEARRSISGAVLARHHLQRGRLPGRVHVPGRRKQHRAAARPRVGSGGRSEDDGARGLRAVLRQPDHRRRRHHEGHQRHAIGVRTLVASLPTTIAAWNAPGRRLPEPASVVSEPRDFDRSRARDAVRASPRRPGSSASCRAASRSRPTSSTCAASSSSSTLDYNPLVPSLGPNRRPADVNGVPGTSASVLQYTSFGETWYRGAHRVGVAAVRRPASVPDQLHAVEGRRQRHRFSERVHRAGQRSRPQSGRPRTDCRSGSIRIPRKGRRCRISGTGSSRAASTCCRRTIELSSIVTIGSGRPYNILAGVDLNGMATAARPIAREARSPISPRRSSETRARCRRRRPSISGWRGDFRSGA